MFDEALVTVWSAPNYCYRCGNMASILTINSDGGRNFTVYDAAEENDRDRAITKRKMVRISLFSLKSSEDMRRVLIYTFRGVECLTLYDQCFAIDSCIHSCRLLASF